MDIKSNNYYDEGERHDEDKKVVEAGRLQMSKCIRGCCEACDPQMG